MRSRYYSVKRADYQAVLHRAALAAGCTIRLGAKATSLDDCTPSLTLANGETLTADLIIAADGMKSRLRALVLPESEDASPLPYPMSTYRAWAPTAALVATNPDIAALLAEPASNVWLGPGRHVIFYPAEGGSILAINGTYPSRTDSVGAWNKEASVAEVQAQFAMFDPVVQAVLAEARDCKSWALAEVPRLSRWRSESGRVVLVGDAAHGMLQFLAQGAAMATEDAGALAECLKDVEGPDGVPDAMLAYERARRWRCERVQAGARRNGDVIHIFDGEEQECRDREMAGEALETDEEVDTGPLLDSRFTAWLYGHDVLEHVSISKASNSRRSADLVSADEEGTQYGARTSVKTKARTIDDCGSSDLDHPSMCCFVCSALRCEAQRFRKRKNCNEMFSQFSCLSLLTCDLPMLLTQRLLHGFPWFSNSS